MTRTSRAEIPRSGGGDTTIRRAGTPNPPPRREKKSITVQTVTLLTVHRGAGGIHTMARLDGEAGMEPALAQRHQK